MTISKVDREKVFERDGWMCCSCGSHHQLTIQHRINRGMGGDQTGRPGLKPVKDMPSNLLTMCIFCNTGLESDPQFRQLGIEYGWKLHQFDNPHRVAANFPWFGQLRLLDDNYGFEIVQSASHEQGF